MTAHGRRIGKGGFANVWQYGTHAPYVAVKSIEIHSDKIKTYTDRELKALKDLEKLSHQNIVKFYGHKQELLNGCENLMIYMEFCERGSLRHVLEDPTVVYNLKTVFGWAEHLASALLCLKENQMVHRDIKPENVFVTKCFILKLGDFGLVKDLKTGSAMSWGGTERYMSPEASGVFGNADFGVLNPERILQTNYKSDLYAMGLVLWEMAERKKVFFPEYESRGIYGIFEDLKKGPKKTLRFTNCDDELADLILQCVRFDYKSRPDIEDFYLKIVLLNSNYNAETFQPLTQINQQRIQKPNQNRKANLNWRGLFEEELIDRLDKRFFGWIDSGYAFDNFDEVKVHLEDNEQEKSALFVNKNLNDAISILKSLAIQKGEFKLLEMFEKRIQNFSKLADDYIFCNDEYPNLPPMINQELLDFLDEQKYGEDFAENIKSALKMCEDCCRNDFKTWLIETSFVNKSLTDAISMLKSLAIQKGEFKLLEIFEKQIQNFSKFPDDYIFCNNKHPNFPPMIDQELLDFLGENKQKQKYEADFVEKIKSALKMCEQGFRNDFKIWLIATSAALDLHRKARQIPSYYLLEAIEQIHSIIGRISDNPFYKQWFVVSVYSLNKSGWGIEFFLSRKENDSQTKRFHFLQKGLHIESCLQDLQDILENLLKDMNIDHKVAKDYLERYQPMEPVFPYRAYRFEWGKRVDECEEIKMSNIDPEGLTDYESLRQAYVCAFKILETHAKRKEQSFDENDLVNQIKICLVELEKPRKCPNYFYFRARELRQGESQDVDILCIDQKGANPLTYFLGDDLIWKWKKTELWFFPPYAIITANLLINLLSDLLSKYESSRPDPLA